MKKRILSLILAMVMVLGMLPVSAFATEATEQAQPAAEDIAAQQAADAVVYVTGAKGGSLILVNKPVTVTDRNEDGLLSYDEALIAAHETYWPDGYASDWGSFGIQVGKLWGEGDGYFANALFYNNDSALQMNVGESYVEEGDRLYACSLKYSDSWNDVYTYFDQRAKTVKAGEEFTLTLSGGGYMGTGLALEEVQVGTWNDGAFTPIPGKQFLSDGTVTLSFAEAGTYIVTAEGEYYGDYGVTPIMPPVCVVTVEAVPETVALDKSEMSMTVGEQQTLTATVTPAGIEVIWSSADAAVATVEDGKITALKAGTTTITATTPSGETASCLVTVSEPVVTYLSALKFTKSTNATSAEYQLLPAFDPAIKEYTLIVPDTNNAVSVWATLAAEQSGAIKVVYQNTSNKSTTKTVKSGDTKGVSLSSVLKSSLDGNTVTITVGDEDACTITIVRQATLKGLTLSYGENTAAMDSEFAADKLEYTVRVPQNAEITVAPSKKINAAVVAVNGAEVLTVTPEWTGLNGEMEIVVSGGTARPEVVPTTYKIHLVQCAVSLEILTPPTKTEYAAGDKFDPTGMTLEATYSDDSTETIGADRFTYPKDALKPNTAEIEIEFDDLTVKQPVVMPTVFEGNGTQADPYLIKTAEDLVTLGKLVEDGLSFEGEYLKMVADIALPDAWEPIGKSLSKPFSGNFDGGNHLLTVPEGGLPLIGTPVNASLSNLNVYGSQIAGYGVVNGYTNDQSYRPAITIDNVTLKAGTQTLKSGFIGGYASGKNVVVIRNCTVEKGVTIGYSKSEKYIGSFGGEFNGTIQNCVSYADVYGSEYVGGIVAVKGQTMGDFIIADCSFGGTVTGTAYVGGIVGHGYAGGSAYGIESAPNAPMVTIQNCTCTGTVIGDSYVGGILGAERATAQAWDNGIGYIQNNSFTGKVYGSGYVGGIVGYMRSLNKYTVVTNNYYAMNCGASTGIGGVEYVDTNCATPEAVDGVTYLNTENGTTDCPKISGCSWKKAHNRTDDPLGADRAKLCHTDTDLEPIPTELKVSGSYKTEYAEGEDLDIGGIVLTVYYNWGDPKTVELKDVTVSGYDKTKTGEQTVTLAYLGLTADISVTVKGAKKEITVSVSVLGDSVHNSDSDGKVHTLAGGNLTPWVSSLSVTLDSDATVFDAVKAALDEQGISFTYSYNAMYGSHYIESVNDLAEFTNGQRSGWMVTVNGVHISVGVSAYTLENGDTVVLHYTDDYAKEGGEVDDTDAAVEKVEDLIDKLDSERETFQLDVEAAREAYDALTAEQKKLVTNYAKLTDALKQLAEDKDVEAAQEVEALIDAIGAVTKDSEAAIQAAREGYDKLTDQQKELVENIAVLEAAEEKLAKLQSAVDPQDAYKATGDYLENLGTPAPGSIGGEWMVIGLLRSGRKVNGAYYEAVVTFVQDNIDENGRLHSAKSTENSRLILALTAMGKDVTDVGGHDLLKGLGDMAYVSKQGINGPIWALIALDSGNYPAPEGDVTREGLVQAILNAQLADGGWALSGSASDPDMTGMALQALAPYCTDGAVKKAVDAALTALSNMQAEDGSFAGMDGSSSESIAQVVAALSALGIDADTDARFVKNGVSALDALCAFFVEGGGFRHTPDGKLDGMATEQGYYALTAYFRMQSGKTALYDMTDVVDMGGDVITVGPAQTQPTEAAPTVPADAPAKESRSFPWGLIIVIAVLGGAIAALVVIKKRK